MSTLISTCVTHVSQVVVLLEKKKNGQRPVLFEQWKKSRDEKNGDFFVTFRNTSSVYNLIFRKTYYV